jgi:enoyl-CoA hydratase/carnithine racemase
MGSEADSPEDEILVEVDDAGVCVITLNRPEARNALTGPMVRRYAALLRAADDDPAVRVIVVTGSGKGFCAGVDLGVLRAGSKGVEEFSPPRQDLPTLTFGLRKPVIAAINGAAVGIGLAYALASDIRFAAASARLGTLFAQLGLVAEYGLSWQLPRLIGLQKAMDVLLSGRLYSATEAAEMGLIHSVVPDDTLLKTAVEYAGTLARDCAPTSLATIKRQVYSDLDRTREDALSDTLLLMKSGVFDQPELREALAARAEKRPPAFAPLPPRTAGAG